MGKKVVIVEALSTGFNLVDDCLERDLEPVILERYFEAYEYYEEIKAARQIKYRKLKSGVTILREDPDYNKTLEMIRLLDPILIIAGSEDGVTLALRLSRDLLLPGNPYELIDKMTNKYYMHKALKDAGVRYIRGEVFDNAEDALNFYDSLDTDRVVIKPPHGAASVGVRFCSSRQEVEENFNRQLGSVGMLGDVTDKLLLQERISGREFIVNTITIDGQHMVTSIWAYEKKALDNGSIVYVGMEAVDTVTPEAFVLTAYAFDVLDAIGIQQGPVHGEYMLDEKGPVLIEVNCRCMGGCYPADYGDKIFGHHETDIALDSYLDPERVRQKLPKLYKTYRHARVKFLISPESIPLKNSPIIGLIPFLKSYYLCSISNSALNDSIHRTIDLETSPGTIYMISDDYETVKKEYDLLSVLESHFFGLLYQASYDPEKGGMPDVIFDDKTRNHITINIPGLKDYPLEDVYGYFRQIVMGLAPGGEVCVPSVTYRDFPYEKEGIIMVLKIMGLEPMLPKHRSEDLFFVKA